MEGDLKTLRYYMALLFFPDISISRGAVRWPAAEWPWVAVNCADLAQIYVFIDLQRNVHWRHGRQENHRNAIKTHDPAVVDIMWWCRATRGATLTTQHVVVHHVLRRPESYMTSRFVMNHCKTWKVGVDHEFVNDDQPVILTYFIDLHISCIYIT